MSESKSARNNKVLEHQNDRPKMNKRVERKDDGRTLIYYTFDEKESESLTESPSNKSGDGTNYLSGIDSEQCGDAK